MNWSGKIIQSYLKNLICGWGGCIGCETEEPSSNLCRDHAFTFAQMPSLGQIVRYTEHSSHGIEKRLILTWVHILEP